MNKYPRTPYWPTSPSLPNKENIPIADVASFLNVPVVITEKIDGCNVELRRGECNMKGANRSWKAPWLAMVKKHHAWKTSRSHVSFFGEDIYGVHSIEYDPVPENETFYIFSASSSMNPDYFLSWWSILEFCNKLEIPHVPLLFQGKFQSEDEIEATFAELMAQPSELGGEKEGLVIRTARAMFKQGLTDTLAKFVRHNHVQPNAKHWRKNWRPCKIQNAVDAGVTDEDGDDEEEW